MKYVSIDIETTCLGPADPKNILMVAMIVEDTKKKLPREELPTFACLVRHDRYDGTPFALWLNSWIFELLAKNDQSKYPIYNAISWVNKAQDFLNEHFPHEKVVPAGKNVSGFDLPFFPDRLRNKFIHRSIDPGSVFIDWAAEKPDSFVDDAWDVIEILRKRY